MAPPATKKSRPRINGRFPKPPFWLSSLILFAAAGSVLLLAMVVRSRTSTSPLPRVHLVQDMDNQVKVKTQKTSLVFADGRAMRPKIPGTVARGQLHEDDHLWNGYVAEFDQTAKVFKAKQYFIGFPADVKVDDALLKRGQTKFNTYCMPCHGYDGMGNGPINARVDQLKLDQATSSGNWVQPSNLTDDARKAREDGHIFNTITNGIRSMGGYGPAIPDPHDRWAIVAYVRALQLSSTGLKPATTQPVAMK